MWGLGCLEFGGYFYPRETKVNDDKKGVDYELKTVGACIRKENTNHSEDEVQTRR